MHVAYLFPITGLIMESSLPFISSTFSRAHSYDAIPRSSPFEINIDLPKVSIIGSLGLAGAFQVGRAEKDRM